MVEGALHLRTPPLPKPPWLLTLSCRLHWFSFTGIKTLAWILLTAQVFTANKNLRLQKHKKGWGCREVTPYWGASPVTQDVIWAQTSERLLSRRIQATREQSMFNSTVLSPLPHCLAFDEAKQTIFNPRKQTCFNYLAHGGWVCNDLDGLPKLLVETCILARNKRNQSNQCFSDEVGGKTCEECTISTSDCSEPCVYGQPSGCELFLMQILLSCFSCSPLLLELKEKRFFNFDCFKEDWLKSAAVWLNWNHMLGMGAGLVRSPCN